MRRKINKKWFIRMLLTKIILMQYYYANDPTD